MARAKQRFICAFVVFHIAAVAGWAFTPNVPRTKFERVVRERLAFYMYPLGLWQTWNMFAPNPAIANAYVEAEVTFADGSRATWALPRMDQLSYWQRFRKERYRKWGNERLISIPDGAPNPILCDAAARFAARQVERPGNPAVTVDLVRYRAPIPPPTRQEVARPSPPAWDRQVIYSRRLDAPSTVPAMVTAPPEGEAQ